MTEAEILHLPTRGWAVISIGHIVPLNDQIQHVFGTTPCSCEPEIDEVTPEELAPGVYAAWRVSHHALDGRE